MGALGLLGACADQTPSAPTTLPPGRAANAHIASIAAVQAGSVFTWLAPLGTGTADPATFDAQANPVVEVCAWTGSACSGGLVARFSTAPTGTDLPLTVNAAAGAYEASWNLLDARFVTRRTYRARVLQGAAELGAVSVDVVRGRWALTGVDGTRAPLGDQALACRVRQGGQGEEIGRFRPPRVTMVHHEGRLPVWESAPQCVGGTGWSDGEVRADR
jgi:hypothetical protein